MARLSEEQRLAIEKDLKATHGTREGATRRVADRHGISQSTVRRIQIDLRLAPFADDEVRTVTKNATAALVADNAARRAAIAKRLLDVAERAIDDMGAPAKIYNFGGKDNTYNEREVPRPPTGDQRNLATVAAIALDKHKMLDGYDAQQGMASAVDDWLGAMMGRDKTDSGDGS